MVTVYDGSVSNTARFVKSRDADLDDETEFPLQKRGLGKLGHVINPSVVGRFDGR